MVRNIPKIVLFVVLTLAFATPGFSNDVQNIYSFVYPGEVETSEVHPKPTWDFYWVYNKDRIHGDQMQRAFDYFDNTLFPIMKKDERSDCDYDNLASFLFKHNDEFPTIIEYKFLRRCASEKGFYVTNQILIENRSDNSQVVHLRHNILNEISKNGFKEVDLQKLHPFGNQEGLEIQTEVSSD